MVVTLQEIGCGAVTAVLVCASDEGTALTAVAEFVAACSGAEFGPVVERCGGVFGAAGVCPTDALEIARFVLDL